MSEPSPPDGVIDGARHLYAVRVYYEDTDLSGIVYHANYLRWFERARSDLLRRLGIDQRAAIEAGGGAYAVSELGMRYLRPARLDDELQVSAQVVEHSACRLAFHQRVMARGEPLCEADVHIACVDATRLRPVRWPSALAEVLNG